MINPDEDRPQWLKKHGQWMREEHIETFRKAVLIAKRHESEVMTNLRRTAESYARGTRTGFDLAEAAEIYAAVKRARQNAQDRYHAAIKADCPQSDKSGPNLLPR